MSDWIGKQLGHYQITGVIGHGGMSTVYRAQQTTVQREVAIKVITRAPDLDPTIIARFEHEVQIITSLEHIHILPIYDFGHEEEYAYLVMRYIDGGSLNVRLRQQPLPLPLTEVERFISQIAAALDYAHERNIVHRDLKPHNILLDKQGNAYLSDFGIAKLVTDELSLTQTGVAIGTPSYMAPEQWQGGMVSGRTDVYALGTLLFELLTGYVPFQAENVLSLMHKQLYEQPPSLTKIRKDIPPLIESIIHRALAKPPEDRFDSAGQFAQALSESLHRQAPPTRELPVTPISVPVMIAEPAIRADTSPTQVGDLEITPFVGRAWVLEAFEDWRSAGETPLFFLTGPNGIGKSELAHRFIESLEGRVLSYELLDTQARSLDPHFFVDKVAAQVDRLFRQTRPTNPTSTKSTEIAAFTDPFEGLENRVLEPLSHEVEPVYLLIDGLELGFDYPGLTIIDLVVKALENGPESLRLIVTAAPDTRLDRLFHDQERLELGPNTDADRVNFVSTLNTRFATLLPNLSKNDASLLALDEKSEGNPLYLNTIFECLLYKWLDPSELAELPAGLDALYAYLIERAEHDNPDMMPVLRILAVGRAPLRSQLLAEIQDMPHEEMRIHLSDLRPLVRHIDPGWTLAHPALRYWMVSTQHESVVEAHRSIAERLSRATPATMDRYALEHLTAHWIAAGQTERAYALLTDLNFIEAKLLHVGLDELVSDLNFLKLTRPAYTEPLDSLLVAIQSIAPLLMKHPNYAFGALYDRLIDNAALREPLAAAVTKRRSPWLRREWSSQATKPTEHTILWGGTSILALAAESSRWLAACGDGYLRLWENGEPVREWEEPSVTTCALSQDGRLALSGRADGVIRLWDLDSETLLHESKGHQQTVTACAFSSDHRFALTASEDRLLHLWALEPESDSLRLVQSFYQHPDSVKSAAFATVNGEPKAISGCADGILRLWDIQKNELIDSLSVKGHLHSVTACAVYQDIAISGATDGEIRVWNLDTRSLIRTLSGHTGGITSLNIRESGDDALIVSTSDDRTTRVWSFTTGQVIATYEGHTQPATGAAFVGDDQIVSAALDGTLRLYKRAAQGQVIEAHGAEVSDCAFSPDSRQMLSASLDRELRLWDAATGQILRLFKGHTGAIHACTVRADGQIALSASSDGTLRTWNLANGQMIRLLSGHQGAVMACAISPMPIKLGGDSARWLAVSGGADRTLRVWDLESGQVLFTLKGHGDTITACNFDSLGKTIISVSADRTIRVWSLETRESLKTIKIEEKLTSAGLSQDGRTLLVGLATGVVQILDLESENIERISEATGAAVSPCGFSGKWLYALSRDGLMRLWNAKDRQPITAFYTEYPLSCGAFNTQSDTLALGDSKGNLYLVKLETPSGGRRKTKS